MSSRLGERPCLKKTRRREQQRKVPASASGPYLHTYVHTYLYHTCGHTTCTQSAGNYIRDGKRDYTPHKRSHKTLSAHSAVSVEQSGRGMTEITRESALFHCSQSPQQIILLAFIWPHLDALPPPPPHPAAALLVTTGIDRNPEEQIAPASHCFFL